MADGKPRLVSPRTLDRCVRGGGLELWRGVETREEALALVFGETTFHGERGLGIWTSVGPEAFASAVLYAGRKGEGRVIRMALPRDATIAPLDEWERSSEREQLAMLDRVDALDHGMLGDDLAITYDTPLGERSGYSVVTVLRRSVLRVQDVLLVPRQDGDGWYEFEPDSLRADRAAEGTICTLPSEAAALVHPGDDRFTLRPRLPRTWAACGIPEDVSPQLQEALSAAVAAELRLAEVQDEIDVVRDEIVELERQRDAFLELSASESP